jgi:hypothetical protein
MRTRDEHLAWCKERAREYLDNGDVLQGVTSMLADLNKHPDTRGVSAKMSVLGLFYIMNHDLAGARRFVEGFN